MSGIQLREIERSDLIGINIWRNDPDVIRLLGANFLFINSTVDERWFENYLSSRNSAVRLALITENNQCIGLVSLTNIHAINRSAEFSIMIGNKEYWSQGIGKSATQKMLQHGFADLNIHRIYLTVLANNTRALSLYKRIGFQEEGVQRDALYKDGAFCDTIAMSLLKSDFYASI